MTIPPLFFSGTLAKNQILSYFLDWTTDESTNGASLYTRSGFIPTQSKISTAFG